MDSTKGTAQNAAGLNLQVSSLALATQKPVCFTQEILKLSILP